MSWLASPRSNKFFSASSRKLANLYSAYTAAILQELQTLAHRAGSISRNALLGAAFRLTFSGMIVASSQAKRIVSHGQAVIRTARPVPNKHLRRV